MAIEVVVTDDRVQTMRKILDPLGGMPTVRTDKKVPNTTFLTYYKIDNEPFFVATAMQYEAAGVTLRAGNDTRRNRRCQMTMPTRSRMS